MTEFLVNRDLAWLVETLPEPFTVGVDLAWTVEQLPYSARVLKLPGRGLVEVRSYVKIGGVLVDPLNGDTFA